MSLLKSTTDLSLLFIPYSHKLLYSASELFLHAFFTKIVLELSYPFGLKEFSATTALYLINTFRLKQQKSSLNLSFNLRIILPLQSPFQ